jgi:hypothetical protein
MSAWLMRGCISARLRGCTQGWSFDVQGGIAVEDMLSLQTLY